MTKAMIRISRRRLDKFERREHQANCTLIAPGKSEDATVPLANVIASAKLLELPVVVPGADHFFHRRLHVTREIVCHAWRH